MPHYRVLVDEHFHYQREEERYDAGIAFDTADEAIIHCKALIEGELRHIYRAGMSAEDLFDIYFRFGIDPFVRPAAPETPSVHFDGAEFARSLSVTIVQEEEGRSNPPSDA